MAEKGELRVLVVGKTGAGKSATCNTLLGESFFKEDFSASSITAECHISASVRRFNRKIEVYDTPGVLDTGKSDAETGKVIAKALMAAAPGPHVVLYVIRLIDRYSEEQFKCFENVKAFLGEKVTGNMIIAFTCGESLESKEKTIEEYIEAAPETLKNVIKACGNRYIVFNNCDKKLNDAQVRQFLDVVDTLGGTVYKDMAMNSALDAEIEKRLGLNNKRGNEEMQPAEKRLQPVDEKRFAEEKAEARKLSAEEVIKLANEVWAEKAVEGKQKKEDKDKVVLRIIKMVISVIQIFIPLIVAILQCVFPGHSKIAAALPPLVEASKVGVDLTSTKSDQDNSD